MGIVLLLGVQLYGQDCPSLQAIMVDPCTDDVNNEYIIIESGSGFNTSDLQISFDSRVNILARENNDINVNVGNFAADQRPCRFQPGNPNLVLGCDNVQTASQDQEIPPGAILIIQMSGGYNQEVDFSYLCGSDECVYVMQNDCVRTTEAFANKGSGDWELLIAVSGTNCEEYSYYDRNLLRGTDGAYYAPGGTTLYDNNNTCSPSEIPTAPPVSGATLPPTFVEPVDVVVCNSYTLPAISGTNLTGNETYYSGPEGKGTIYPAESVITRPTVLYIFDPTAPCSPNPSFQILFDPNPDPELAVPDVFCDSANPFPLETRQEGISGNWSGPGVSNNTFIPSIAGTGLKTLTFSPDPGQCANPKTVDTFVSDDTGAADSLSVIICDDTGTGLASFDLTAIEPDIVGNGTGQVLWFEDEALTVPITDITSYVTDSTLIYATLDDGSCVGGPTRVTLITSQVPTIAPTGFSGLSCVGDRNGILQFSISGGLPPYDIVWSDPAFNGLDELTGIGSEPYFVTVTDARQCQTEAGPFTLPEPVPLEFVCDKVQDVSNGISQDGIASVTFSGGQPPYTISWSGPTADATTVLTPGTINIESLAGGVYDVTLTDGFDCITTCQVEIEIPNCNLEVSGTGNSPTCFGADNGSIQLTTSGVQGAITYEWNVAGLNGQSSPNNLASGFYQVTVTDEAICPRILSFDLAPPPLLELSCDVLATPSFPGAQDGQTRIQLSGGTPPYTVSWTGAETGSFSTDDPGEFFIDDLSAGTYDLVITDANNCEQNCSFNLAEGTCPNDLSLEGVNETCPGARDGSIRINFAGTWVEPITIAWSDDQFDGETELSNLGAGTYSLTATDANNCEVIANIDIATDNETPELDFTANAAVCQGACFTYQLQFTGSPPFNAAFVVRAGGQDFPLNVTSNQLSDQLEICPSDFGVNSGSLQLILLSLSDANCVNDQDQESVLNLVDAVASDLSSTLCPGASVEVNGQIYDFDRPSGVEVLVGASQTGCDSIVNINLNFATESTETIEQELCNGESITVNGQVYDSNRPSGTELLTTANGCDSTIVINLTFTDAVTGQFETSICAGEELAFNGRIFNEQNPTGSVLLPGAASNGCDSIIEVRVSFFPEAREIITPSICRDGQININGIVYDASNPGGEQVLPGLSENGCDSILEVSLNLIDEVRGSFDTTLCLNEQIIVNGTIYDADNLSGTESFPGQSFSGCDSILEVSVSFFEEARGSLDTTLCVGEQFIINGTTYDAARTDGIEIFAGQSINGCDSILEVSLSFFPEAQGTFSPTLCPDEQVVINGNVYDILNPSGTEILPGQSTEGCDSIVQIALNFRDIPTTILRDTLCRDGSITLNGTVYDINRPSGEERLVNPNSNCDSIVQVELFFLEDIEVSLVGEENICLGDSATLEIRILHAPGPVDLQFTSNDNNPEWIFGVQDGDLITVKPEVSTVFAISEVNTPAAFCPATISGQASVNVNQLTVDAAIESHYDGYGVSCQGEIDGAVKAIVLDGQEPIQYLWEDGSTNPNRSNLAAGVYSVQVSDASGCVAEASASLEAPPEVTMEASVFPLDCQNDQSGMILIDTVLGGNGFYEYSLNEAPPISITQFPQAIGGLSLGNYTLIISDEFGCSTQPQEFEVSDPPPISLELGPDQKIEYGESVLLKVDTNFEIDSVIWSPSDSLDPVNSLPSRAFPATTTTYELIAFDERGCSASDEITIFVSRERSIYVPTAFSPNNDGINDFFFPYTNGSIKQIMVFKVFDRWGNLMHEEYNFQGNLAEFGWDGYFRGKPMNAAVFIFFVKAEYLDGQEIMIKGDFTLVK